MFRITKKDGVLGVQVNSVDSFMYRFANWLYKISFGTISTPVRLGYPIHQSVFFDKKTLTKSLAYVGFEVIMIKNHIFNSGMASISRKSFIAKTLFCIVNTVGNILDKPIDIIVYARKP